MSNKEVVKLEELLDDSKLDISDDCERKDCDGTYEYSFNGGGTCNKCGHRIPCF